jgi:hypothetical protein
MNKVCGLDLLESNDFQNGKQQGDMNTRLIIRQAEKCEAIGISGMIATNIRLSFSKHHSKDELKVWTSTYSPGEIERHILEREVFVLQFNGELRGTIQLDGHEIKGFYTNPKGVGFGNILMQFMLCRLRLSGRKWACLTSNEWAVEFYKRHKFKVLCKTVMYYEGYPFEEFFMRREL